MSPLARRSRWARSPPAGRPRCPLRRRCPGSHRTPRRLPPPTRRSPRTTPKQSASLANRASRRISRCRSRASGFPLSHAELAFLISPVAGEIAPGMPIPTREGMDTTLFQLADQVADCLERRVVRPGRAAWALAAGEESRRPRTSALPRSWCLRGRCRPAAPQRGSPNPPPPGVSTINRSPGSTSQPSMEPQTDALPVAPYHRLLARSSRPRRRPARRARPRGAGSGWRPTRVRGSAARVPAPSPAAKTTRTARPLPDPEALHAHRIAILENLGVGDPGVGHVAVHRAGAMVPRAGAATPTQRLVVHP